MTVKEYIFTHIAETTRKSDGKDPDLVVLPKPYTVPSMKDSFQEMYYWDTYFTNKGLILTGNVRQAIHNLENFVFLIKKFGYIPNGTRTPLLNRSQPPFFGLAIKDLWAYLSDLQKQSFIKALKMEYAFWQNRRTNAYGFEHYDAETNEEEYLAFAYFYERRVGIETPHTVERGRDIMAEAESGWDFCPRFPNGCTKYAAVDLSSLLYADEMLLAEIDTEHTDFWLQRAKERKEKMSRMQDVNGVFFDYDCTTQKYSEVYSCAGFFPYFVGVSKDRAGFETLLAELEYPYGVVSAKTEQKGFQWATPNGWAPLFYVCVAAAIAVGDESSARRIAKKYIDILDEIFQKTGALYEKYDVVTGKIGIGEEYGTPEMLGWTAGIYLSLQQYLESGKLI
jgi:alpha,alpha-trehalase